MDVGVELPLENIMHLKHKLSAYVIDYVCYGYKEQAKLLYSLCEEMNIYIYIP